MSYFEDLGKLFCLTKYTCAADTFQLFNKYLFIIFRVLVTYKLFSEEATTW